MTFVTGGRPGASAAISPDGRRIVFNVQEAPQKVSLWVRAIDALTAQPLPGTEDASFPFWSPDSRWIGYFAHGKLMKIDANGGPPQTLCDAVPGRGGAWSREGVILFGAGVGPAGTGGPLKRVSSAGGPRVAATKIASGDHRFPSFLPDGRHFFFYTNGAGDQDGIYIGSLDSLESKRIINAESSAVYAAGRALFVRQATLLAQPFDLQAFTMSGDPVPIAERVTRNFQGLMAFSASDSGVLAYGIGPTTLTSEGAAPVQLVWVDRQGKTIGTVGKPAAFRGVDLAPDGKRIAAHVHEGTGGDIWIMDDARTERFTFDASAENESPAWSPDGEWIAFAKNGAGQKGIYRKRANNAGSEELLLASTDVALPQSWSPDGTAIVFSQNRATGPVMSDLYRLPLSGDRKATPLVNDPGNQILGQVSPDAHWLAYVSGEGGGLPDVYVRAFGRGAGKYQVATGGSSSPRWRGDGRELFFLEAVTPRSVRGKLMAVDVGPGETSFERSAPHPLFDSGVAGLPHPPTAAYRPYAVSRDGQRFLMPRLIAEPREDLADSPVAVVLDWAAALKR
jgi:eukaryotic-like serine/threonine-protein kinase